MIAQERFERETSEDKLDTLNQFSLLLNRWAESSSFNDWWSVSIGLFQIDHFNSIDQDRTMCEQVNASSVIVDLDESSLKKLSEMLSGREILPRRLSSLLFPFFLLSLDWERPTMIFLIIFFFSFFLRRFAKKWWKTVRTLVQKRLVNYFNTIYQRKRIALIPVFIVGPSWQITMN